MAANAHAWIPGVVLLEHVRETNVSDLQAITSHDDQQSLYVRTNVDIVRIPSVI